MFLITGERLIPCPDRPIVKAVYRWIKGNLGIKNSMDMTAEKYDACLSILKSAHKRQAHVPGTHHSVAEWGPIAQFYFLALRELAVYGVGFRDFHSANVMMNPGGGRKLIDLGLSSS